MKFFCTECGGATKCQSTTLKNDNEGQPLRPEHRIRKCVDCNYMMLTEEKLVGEYIQLTDKDARQRGWDKRRKRQAAGLYEKPFRENPDAIGVRDPGKHPKDYLRSFLTTAAPAMA